MPHSISLSPSMASPKPTMEAVRQRSPLVAESRRPVVEGCLEARLHARAKVSKADSHQS